MSLDDDDFDDLEPHSIVAEQQPNRPTSMLVVAYIDGDTGRVLFSWEQSDLKSAQSHARNLDSYFDKRRAILEIDISDIEWIDPPPNRPCPNDMCKGTDKMEYPWHTHKLPEDQPLP